MEKSLEKAIKLDTSFFRFHYFPFVVAGLLLTVCLPMTVGMVNLGWQQSALVMEHFFTIIGLIVFLPLYLPDMDASTLDMILTKKTPYTVIIIARLVQILVVAAVLLITFLEILVQAHSVVDFLDFFEAGFADVLFVGGLSAVTFVFSRHPVPSLMLPMIYYLISMFTRDKYLKDFYLFSLADKNWHSKILLGVSGIVLIFLSIMLANHRRCKE